MARFIIGFFALVTLLGHRTLARPDIADGIGTAFAAGMTVAMSAIDGLSQGAAIRGGSETSVDALGQKMDDKRNMETGFGQAIMPGGTGSDESGEERKKREAVPCGGGGRGGGGGGGGGGTGGGGNGGGGQNPPDDVESVGGGEGAPARLQQRGKGNKKKRSRRAIQPVVDPYAVEEYPTSPASVSRRRRRRSPEGNFTTQVERLRRDVGASMAVAKAAATSTDNRSPLNYLAASVERVRRDVGQMPDGEPGEGGSFADGLSSALSRFVDAAKRLASRMGEMFSANEADGTLSMPEDVETLSA